MIIIAKYKLIPDETDQNKLRVKSEEKSICPICLNEVLKVIGSLTDDFKKTYNGMPWTQIKALRNIIAHSYGKIDVESLWETITGDIPELKRYCSRIV